jgi:hypothetical protein
MADDNGCHYACAGRKNLNLILAVVCDNLEFVCVGIPNRVTVKRFIPQ